MLEKLHLKNVGPAPELEMEFAPRLNIITGDNGLGKSFILDVAWFALTGNWLSQSNMAMPFEISKNSKINYTKYVTGYNSFLSEFDSDPSLRIEESVFNYFRRTQTWEEGSEFASKAIPNTKLSSVVISLGVADSISIYDPFRDLIELSRINVWNGLEKDGKIVSQGLIRDWGFWQLENGETFSQFVSVLKVLSPNIDEPLIPGKLTQVNKNDAQDIPTLKTPYGQEVPITQASAAIKRIISIAYILVWSWRLHLRAATLVGREPSKMVVLLFDELENHLHPQWQRKILDSLLNVVKEIMQNDVKIQIITTTHSPLVMASLEPLFDPKQDAWFDFNLVKGEVTLEKMPWYKRGGAEEWLTSEAFDLDSTGSLENARVKNLAAKALNNPKLSKKKFLELDTELRNVLPEMDEFWIRWRFIGEKKGYL
jgi:predicted ATPase